MNHALLACLVLLLTTLVSSLLVPATRPAARRLGVLDHPGERKVHSAPTPRLGGVAVYASFVLVVASGQWLVPWLSTIPTAREWIGDSLTVLHEAFRIRAKLAAILGGATVAFVVGLLDDALGARFHWGVKVLGQTLAAAALVAAGVQVTFLPYAWMNVLVTLLWIVGITNAFNLLDNLDGLSAGVAFVASLVLLLNSWPHGELFISLILLAFMGSLLGFLFFNFHPASVFLGDCGSLFIGFVMGSLTLLPRYVSSSSSTLFPVLMPLVVLAVPLIDTATVIVIRLREGRPIYVGDNCHLSHRLRALGFSTRATAFLIYLATFCLGVSAVFLTEASPGESVLLLLQAAGFVALILLLMFIDRRRQGEDPGEYPLNDRPSGPAAGRSRGAIRGRT